MPRKLVLYFLVLHSLSLLTFVVQAQSLKNDGWVSAGKLKIRYNIQGQGPVLIFLHGGYLDMHSWDNEAAYFSKKYKVVRIDLPGHGQTTGIDTGLMVQDVIKTTMDKLHITRANLIGLSLGAACVIDFALAYPNKINKLVLVSSGFKRLG